jgi:serine/threonine protein kinase
MEQILLTMDLFKNKNVVHRDIKLENVLIKSIDDSAQYEVRVADFGLACITPNDEYLYTKCGSPGYIAPEVFTGEGYSYKADLFSIGCVFYNLLTGQFLFRAETADQCLRLNAECDVSVISPHISHLSEHCQDLLMWLLEADPEDRPTAKEALNHDWFQEDKDVIRELLQQNKSLKKAVSVNARNFVPKSFNGCAKQQTPSGQRIDTLTKGGSNPQEMVPMGSF